MSILKIVKGLIKTPGGESDPEAWLTRFMAHMAVGGCLFVACMVLFFGVLGRTDPLAAALGACAIYAGVETTEWMLARRRRSWTLFWDCVLDWCAVATMSGMFWAAWTNWPLLMLLFMALALVIAEAGVVYRMRRKA